MILSTGGCLILGGVPGPGGGAWSWGMGAWSWGAPGPGGFLMETPGTATAAGGTHPTGMHSCVGEIFLPYLGVITNQSCFDSYRLTTASVIRFCMHFSCLARAGSVLL